MFVKECLVSAVRQTKKEKAYRLERKK